MNLLIWEWQSRDKMIDYLRIHLCLPRIGVERSVCMISGAPCFWIGFHGQTEIAFQSEEDVDWRFDVCFLGFGFSVHRQWSY